MLKSSTVSATHERNIRALLHPRLHHSLSELVLPRAHVLGKGKEIEVVRHILDLASFNLDHSNAFDNRLVSVVFNRLHAGNLELSRQCAMSVDFDNDLFAVTRDDCVDDFAMSIGVNAFPHVDEIY